MTPRRFAGCAFLVVILCLGLAGSSASAAERTSTESVFNLIACPDCGQSVSRRAIMCPHCGCPGDAIKDAVAAHEAAERPPPIYPVAAFKTGSAQGAAVAYTDGENRYLLIDAYSLMGASTLQITPLATNAPIPYHAMQVAAEAPLVRFKTTATNLVFLSRAPLRTGRVHAPMWLRADANTTPRSSTEGLPQTAVALLNSQTNLVAVLGRGPDGIPLRVPLNTTWIDITPSLFREQTASLLAAHQAATQRSLTPEAVKDLNNTQWATPFFRSTAEQIIKLSE